jgi:NADPH-ferrihemoprotein reductase
VAIYCWLSAIGVSETNKFPYFAMEIISFWDIIFIKTGILGIAIAYGLTLISRLHAKRNPVPSVDHLLAKPPTALRQTVVSPTQSIKSRLDQTSRECIIFYGSQTGTAERFAMQLAKNAKTRFGLASVVADLDDFDYSDLKTLGSDRLVIFILATYGEGAPTDNAIDFDQFLKTMPKFAKREGLNEGTFHLQYAIFGLGNSSYQQYNKMAIQTDVHLQDRGATRLGQLGLGDDGKGTLDDDFILWQDDTLRSFAKCLELKQLDYTFTPDFQITEHGSSLGADVFLGEPNNIQRKGKLQGPFSARNPLPASVVEARDLFSSLDRHCVHVEFDISGTSVIYETGDHLALSPINSNLEVHRFLQIFGLSGKENTVISANANDATVKQPLPPKTTYEAAARYYLDIAAPVPRQVLVRLSNFIDDASAREQLIRLGSNAIAYTTEVSCYRLNLAQILSKLSGKSKTWPVPFSFLIENIPPLRPRYYSISSTPLIDKKRISITAVVDHVTGPDWPFEFKGVASNYLLALKTKLIDLPTSVSLSAIETHQLGGPRNKLSNGRAWIHVRRSKFRLPKSSSTPIIMVGPGTGVAPFRGFVRERSFQARLGAKIGKTMLFYGCRGSNEDYLYEDEWKVR